MDHRVRRFMDVVEGLGPQHHVIGPAQLLHASGWSAGCDSRPGPPALAAGDTDGLNNTRRDAVVGDIESFQHQSVSCGGQEDELGAVRHFHAPPWE